MLYFLNSRPMLACYDGEGSDEPDPVKMAEAEARRAQEDAERKVAEARQVAEEARKAREARFSQEDLNRALAEDRRKHQEKFKTLEDSYETLLADKTLAVDQRAKLEADLADLQKAHRTEKEQKEYELRQLQAKAEQDLTQVRTQATQWENMFKSSVIARSLQDAAISADAFNPHQIVDLLKPITRMAEQLDDTGKSTGQLIPVVDFTDIDEATGERKAALFSPEQAVQRMKQLPEMYGNLFKANVVSGIGTGSATGGVTPGTNGQVDVRKLSAEQFRKIYKENPSQLGLRPRRN